MRVQSLVNTLILTLAALVATGCGSSSVATLDESVGDNVEDNSEENSKRILDKAMRCGQSYARLVHNDDSVRLSAVKTGVMAKSATGP